MRVFQLTRLLSPLRNLRSISLNLCCSSDSLYCCCTILSLYTSLNCLYAAKPLFDNMSYDTLFVYMKKSSTGESCLKSLKKMINKVRYFFQKTLLLTSCPFCWAFVCLLYFSRQLWSNSCLVIFLEVTSNEYYSVWTFCYSLLVWKE